MDSKPNGKKGIFISFINLIKKFFDYFIHGGIKRIILLSIIIIVIIGGAATAITMQIKGSSNKAVNQLIAVVKKGNISTTITGSGPIASSNKSTILSKLSSTVTQVYFKRGDKVKAGDLIMELDTSDAAANVSTNESNLQQAQLSQGDNIDDVSNLNPRAPFDGQITNVTINVGDNAGNNAPLMTISDTTKLKLMLSFSAVNIKGVTVGKDVTVNVQDMMEFLNGKVMSVSSLPYTTSQGGSLYNVEIQIDNPGSLKEGMKANADVETEGGTVSSIDIGTMKYVNKQLVRTPGGIVKNVYVFENGYVKKGTVLVSLENRAVILNKSTTDIKIQNLENQLKIANEQLDSCKITAPFDGVISNINAKVGDDIKAGVELVQVFNDKAMEFNVSVDELDIQKVEVGQQSNITIDAVTATSTKPLSGKVSDIAIQGTSNSGVTTYPVTVSIDNPENLKIGMNANAEIFLVNKIGVLYVPLEAIQKVGEKNYVMLKSDVKTVEKMKKDGTYPNIFSNNSSNRPATGGTGRTGGTGGNASSTQRAPASASNNITQNASYYADTIPTQVEVGVTNESYIEITSGLKEGAVVVLPPAVKSSSSSSTNNNQQNRNTFGGGMGVGVPAIGAGGGR